MTKITKEVLQRAAKASELKVVGYVYGHILDELVRWPNTPQEAPICQTPFGVHNVPLYAAPRPLPTTPNAKADE